MGDCQKCDLRVDFDRTVRLTFVGSKVTSDAGLLAYRELDEALVLTATAGKRLEDSRTGRNTRHALLPLIRQSIYSRLAGYEDVNDSERLCVDPSMRHIVGGRASQPEKMAASSSELGRFETEMLASRGNLTTLVNLPEEWVDSVSQQQPLKKLILDMDSSVSETYGNQQGSAYNGHFEYCCYHPAVPIQSVRRRGTSHAPTWQSRQREILAPCAVASDCSVRPLQDPEVLS
jgi:Transposase DDE domain group 1